MLSEGEMRCEPRKFARGACSLHVRREFKASEHGKHGEHGETDVCWEMFMQELGPHLPVVGEGAEHTQYDPRTERWTIMDCVELPVEWRRSAARTLSMYEACLALDG